MPRTRLVLALLLLPLGCRGHQFPDVPEGYREFAYVSNGASNTVSVLDLVYVRPDRTLQVGLQPSGLAVNPQRNEIYAVNTLSGTVSIIDAETNRVAATVAVHKLPYFIDVDASGHRAYVANSGSNTVSVLDLDLRREIGTAGTGEQPGLARIAPDMRTLVVTNRGSGSVSVYAVGPYTAPSGTLTQALTRKRSRTRPAPVAHVDLPRLRAAFPGCPGATDAAILPDSSKVFVACSGGHQVMAISLAADPASWAAKQNSALLTDHLLAMLDVGATPVHLAMKPDGGEIFVSNFDADSFTEISTQTNEVGGTYTIGSKPVFGLVGRDNSTLYVSSFGADTINAWGIDEGQRGASIPAGHAPDALAFSSDQHLLLAADARSGDVAVIRMDTNSGPTLYTILPAGGSPNAIVVKASRQKNSSNFAE